MLTEIYLTRRKANVFQLLWLHVDSQLEKDLKLLKDQYEGSIPERTVDTFTHVFL